MLCIAILTCMLAGQETKSAMPTPRLLTMRCSSGMMQMPLQLASALKPKRSASTKHD